MRELHSERKAFFNHANIHTFTLPLYLDDISLYFAAKIRVLEVSVGQQALLYWKY